MHLPAERPRTALFTVPPPPVLVGRVEEMTALLSKVRTARAAGRPVLVSAVHGMAGVGKTALARTVADRLAEEFPDARLEVELFGFTPGEEPREAADVLAELLSLAGFDAAQLPASLPGKSQLWRSWLAGRRVLLLLDNVRDADQVRPLLPGAASGCLTLITSRHELDALEDVARFSLDTLPVEDAIALLDHLSGRMPNPGEGHRAELARLCGRLPIALRAVGALLAEMADADLVEAMRSATRPLLNVPEGERAVAAAFAVSYHALDADAQRTLRACAWHPGPDFNACSLAALTEVAQPIAAVALAGLAKRSMLLRLRKGRYGFHDLFLGYALEYSRRHDARAAVAEGRERLYARLGAMVETAVAKVLGNASSPTPRYTGPMFDTPASARDWLASTAGELRRVALAALEAAAPVAFGLAEDVAAWLLMDDRADQAEELREKVALDAGRSGDRRHEARALTGLGKIARMRDERDRAEEFFRKAFELYLEIGDQVGRMDALWGLGDVALRRDEFDQAEQAFQQAYELGLSTGSRKAQGRAVTCLADVAAMRGESDRAAERYGQALTLYQEAGALGGQADALQGLADVAVERGELDEAVERYGRALALYEEIGDRNGQANSLWGLGDVALRRDEFDQAEQAFQRIYKLWSVTGNRRNQAGALQDLADVAVRRGELDQAVERYERASRLYAELGDRLGQADAICGLGDVAVTRDEYDRAAEAYRQARRLYEELGDRNGQADVSLGEARMADRRGDRDLACAAYARAGDIYRVIGLTDWVDHCAQERSRLGCA
ncbi:tetratricopeptide repeat protein [Streptosporangium carneum]|nr:tetratricopeptide repeat protein [Streptosporangium carneum]